MAKQIYIGSDHSAVNYKKTIIDHLTDKGYEVHDLGTYSEEATNYANYGIRVGEHVRDTKESFGIVICGTGIGISIAANKVNRIRASLVYTTETAEITRLHNDSNVLALGARITPVEEALRIVDVFLATPFEGGRHEDRIAKISDYEVTREKRKD